MITLKPTFRFWLMTNFLWILFISLLFVGACLFRLEWYLSYFLGVVTILMATVCAWNFVVLRSISYIIDSEQLIVKRGVFNRITNYMELYRVYDYQKTQNIIEVAFGIMNVVILSRDMSNPKVVLMGISNNDSVIPFIRERVETEKQRKRIVEFNNPAVTF